MSTFFINSRWLYYKRQSWSIKDNEINKKKHSCQKGHSLLKHQKRPIETLQSCASNDNIDISSIHKEFFLSRNVNRIKPMSYTKNLYFICFFSNCTFKPKVKASKAIFLKSIFKSVNIFNLSISWAVRICPYSKSSTKSKIMYL